MKLHKIYEVMMPEARNATKALMQLESVQHVPAQDEPLEYGLEEDRVRLLTNDASNVHNEQHESKHARQQALHEQAAHHTMHHDTDMQALILRLGLSLEALFA